MSSYGGIWHPGPPLASCSISCLRPGLPAQSMSVQVGLAQTCMLTMLHTCLYTTFNTVCSTFLAGWGIVTTRRLFSLRMTMSIFVSGAWYVPCSIASSILHLVIS